MFLEGISADHHWKKNRNIRIKNRMEFPEQRQKIKEAGQGKVRNEDKARGSLCGCKHKHKHAQLFSENTAEHVGVFSVLLGKR